MQEELFVKSSRVAMILALPFCAGLALFAGDLVDHVLGAEWEPAVILIQGLARRRRGPDRLHLVLLLPRARRAWVQAVESGVLAGTSCCWPCPRALAWGTAGFLAGRAAGMACVLAVRRVYLRRLLPGVRVEALALRAAIPAALASAAVLAIRLSLWGGERQVGQALGELALWCGARRRARAAARRSAAARAARAGARTGRGPA